MIHRFVYRLSDDAFIVLEDKYMEASALGVILCGLVLGTLLSSWGIGSFMAAIGKVRGWNTKRTFWVSAILYTLLIVGVVIAGLAVMNAWMNGVSQTFLATGVLLIALLVIGLLISPLANLMLRSRYPEVFKESTSSQATPNSTAQVVMERETPLLKSSSPTSNDMQAKLVSAMQPDNKPNVNTSSGHIFVSYRRSDSADIAGRVYDRLIGKFGRAPIFKDVDSIPLGLDFKEYLDQKVGECDVLLAIIGDRWLDASDSTGKHRLDDPADFVRIEIQSALERGIPVIPLLVRDAHMPREESLPSSLRKLVYRNGIPIRSDPDFHRDMDRLIAALEKYVRQEK